MAAPRASMGLPAMPARSRSLSKGEHEKGMPSCRLSGYLPSLKLSRHHFMTCHTPSNVCLPLQPQAQVCLRGLPKSRAPRPRKTHSEHAPTPGTNRCQQRFRNLATPRTPNHSRIIPDRFEKTHQIPETFQTPEQPKQLTFRCDLEAPPSRTTINHQIRPIPGNITGTHYVLAFLPWGAF
eukprot:9477641-Pyramimonas_sp.AAC.1